MMKNILIPVLVAITVFFIGLFYSTTIVAQGKIKRIAKVHTKVEPPKYSVSGIISGHEYVDLGLPSGKKWATCNVEAQTPYGEGLFFVWGSNEPQEEQLIQHIYTRDIRKEISNYSGNDKYDAATKIMGQPWRTPTIEELEELVQECEWHFIASSDFQGYQGIGPSGKSILLPCTSWYKKLGKDQYKFYKHSARYWSCTLEPRYGDVAYILKFRKGLELPTVFSEYGGYESDAVCANRTIRAITN